MNIKGDNFLWQCKTNYLKGITPSNPVHYDDEDYKKVIDFGREYINNNGLHEFSFFLRESQYFVPLWTAHIILEYEKPNNVIKSECLDAIKEYAHHPINFKIADEEKDWLENNIRRFE